MQMETERLILRAPQVEDVEDYLEFRNSEFVLRYNAMSVQSYEQAVKELGRDYPEGGAFAMECKKNGKMIGMIFVGQDSLRWGVASRELSYYLHEAYSRQGYMSEALRTVIGWLSAEKKLDCVAARSFAPNIASQKLLESLGFHRDGLIPRCVKGYGDIVFDDVLYSIQF